MIGPKSEYGQKNSDLASIPIPPKWHDGLLVIDKCDVLPLKVWPLCAQNGAAAGGSTVSTHRTA